MSEVTIKESASPDDVIDDPRKVFAPIRIPEHDHLRVSLEKDDPDVLRLTLSDDRGSEYWPSEVARKKFMERFPEKHTNKSSADTRHTVPATDVAATIIQRLWPKDQLSFSEDAEIVFRYLCGMARLQQAAMRRVGEYHEYLRARKPALDNGFPIPQFIEQVHFHGDLLAMPHQSVAMANGENNDAFGYFMEPGVGKTCTLIGEIERDSRKLRQTQTRLYRGIIVVPRNIRLNWRVEFERFGSELGRAIVLDYGDSLDRANDMVRGLVPQSKEQLYVIFIISYEGLTNMWDFIERIPYWDLGAYDESHYFKWHGTKRAKIALKFRDKCRTRRILTGTPVCNNPYDLWTQLEFLRKGGSGFKTFESFRRFYGVYREVDPGRGIKRLVNVQNLPFMRERLARMAMIVRKAEALPFLPSKTYDIVEVTMTDRQQEIYDAVSQQLLYEIESEISDQTRTINPQNILTRLLRLAQITSGFVTLDAIQDFESGEVLAPKIVEAIDPNPKLEALVELFKEKDEDSGEVRLVKEPTSKTIIGSCWTFDIRTISKRLTDEGIRCVEYYGQTSEADREAAVQAFMRDPEMGVMVMNPAAGGVGLNLIGYPPGEGDKYETNCDHVIIYSQGWSAAQRIQLEGRPHRNGTRVQVRFTDLTVPNTIDEEIRARVVNKQQVALQVQDVRSIVTKLRAQLGKE